MNPYRNTHSRSNTYNESLYIVPATSPTSPSLPKYDLKNIHSDIISKTTMTDKDHSDMKTLNEHIYDMLTKLTNPRSKTDKQEEQLTDISSKISNYEERNEKLSIKETKIHPFSLHITDPPPNSQLIKPP